MVGCPVDVCKGAFSAARSVLSETKQKSIRGWLNSRRNETRTARDTTQIVTQATLGKCWAGPWLHQHPKKEFTLAPALVYPIREKAIEGRGLSTAGI